MGTQDRIVIVGGGLAAARVARAFRDAGGEGSVSILSADTDPPYNRPPLSKGFLRGELDEDAVFVEPAETYAELEIDLRLGCEVTAVRPWRADGRARRRQLALLRPAGARIRLAAASARDARRDAGRRAHLPHAARREGRPRGGRGGLRRARDRWRVHRHGDHSVAAPARPRGHAGRPRRPALRLSAGAGAVGLARAPLPRAWRGGDPRRRRRGVPRQRWQADGRGHQGRARDRGPAGDRRRRRAALDRLSRRLGRRAREGHGARRRALREQRPRHLRRRRHRQLLRSDLRPPAADPALDERQSPGRPPRTPAGRAGHSLRPGGVLLLGGLRHQDRAARRSRRRPRRARDARLARGGSPARLVPARRAARGRPHLRPDAGDAERAQRPAARTRPRVVDRAALTDPDTSPGSAFDTGG